MKSRITAEVANVTSNWWMLVISGIAWVLLSLAILQFSLTSVWSIAILTGIVLFTAAATEFAVSRMAPRWRWAHVTLGVLFLAGGVVAFVWPAETFVVLARLISWYLLILGTFEIVESLANRTELWGLRLITGIASIAIAIWAAESLTRSATLLVLWIGLGALMRGVTQLFMAFEWRQIYEAAKSIAVPASPIPEEVTLPHDGRAAETQREGRQPV